MQREIKLTKLTGAAIGKGNFRHFMEKELHEHPAVIGDTLHRMVNPGTRAVALPDLPFDLATLPRITISACGSAFYAGLVGRWWFEAIARLPTDGDVASEFRYRTPPLPRGGLGLLVSQSGETADTLAALRYMRGQGQHVLSILNVPESSMARESDAVLETVAGPEIGVASTKAFTAQLSVLACLALGVARARQAITAEQEAAMTAALLEVPSRAAEVLEKDAAIQALAQRIAQARDVLYLGRGNCFPIALEGALKLKEISYIHAEGYAAGEMKHGPIALIDRAVPVIAIVPSGPLFEKTASNLQEAAARGGQVIVFSDPAGAAKLQGIATEVGGAAGGRSLRGADPVRHSGPVAGVPRGGAEGHRRGSAAQPGEVGDGGIARLLPLPLREGAGGRGRARLPGEPMPTPPPPLAGGVGGRGRARLPGEPMPAPSPHPPPARGGGGVSAARHGASCRSKRRYATRRRLARSR